MKQIFLALAIALVGTTGFSQATLELKAGINAATIKGKDVTGYKAKTGLYLGGLAHIPLSTSIGIQPEIYYSADGAKWKDEDAKTILHYLKIPALVRYNAGGFNAVTGPQLGFLLSAKDEEEKETTDIKEYLKKSDFSWAFGVGYSVSPLWSLNARYNLGLSKFYEEEKNSSIQIGVQYRLLTASKRK